MVTFCTANKLKNIIFAWSWTLNIFIFECWKEIYFSLYHYYFFCRNTYVSDGIILILWLQLRKRQWQWKMGPMIFFVLIGITKKVFQVRHSCIQRLEDKLTQYKFTKFVFFIEINIIFHSENKVFWNFFTNLNVCIINYQHTNIY